MDASLDDLVKERQKKTKIGVTPKGKIALNQRLGNPRSAVFKTGGIQKVGVDLRAKLGVKDARTRISAKPPPADARQNITVPRVLRNSQKPGIQSAPLLGKTVDARTKLAPKRLVNRQVTLGNLRQPMSISTRQTLPLKPSASQVKNLVVRKRVVPNFNAAIVAMEKQRIATESIAVDVARRRRIVEEQRQQNLFRSALVEREQRQKQQAEVVMARSRGAATGGGYMRSDETPKQQRPSFSSFPQREQAAPASHYSAPRMPPQQHSSAMQYLEPMNAPSRIQNAVVRAHNNNQRLETQQAHSFEGTRVVVANLAPSVSREDIVELFGAIGALREVKMVARDTAHVFFVKRDDAIESIRQYDRRELDSQVMYCSTERTPPPASPPRQAASPKYLSGGPLHMVSQQPRRSAPLWESPDVHARKVGSSGGGTMVADRFPSYHAARARAAQEVGGARRSSMYDRPLSSARPHYGMRM